MNDSDKVENGRSFTDKMLLELARDTRDSAYAPYSGFTVGAACRGLSGIAYQGCNVENSSYPVGICAERVSVAAAIAHGETGITHLAIAGAKRGEEADSSIRPCGMCLQFLSEFMSDDGKILIADGVDSYVELTLGNLLPHAFRLAKNETEQ